MYFIMSFKFSLFNFTIPLQFTIWVNLFTEGITSIDYLNCFYYINTYLSGSEVWRSFLSVIQISYHLPDLEPMIISLNISYVVTFKSFHVSSIGTLSPSCFECGAEGKYMRFSCSETQTSWFLFTLKIKVSLLPVIPSLTTSTCASSTIGL